VAYSRVHTRVHYPGGTVVGSLIGEATGQAVAGLTARSTRLLFANLRNDDREGTRFILVHEIAHIRLYHVAL
jgi:membrane-associated phospholipid phosphatase